MSDRKKSDVEWRSTELVPAFSKERPLVPMNDARVQTIIAVWLKKNSPGTARTYGTVIKYFLGKMHVARDIGHVIKEVDGKEFLDWDGIIRADVVKQLNATEIKDYLAARQMHGFSFIRKGHLVHGKPIGHRRVRLELAVIRSMAEELYLENVIDADTMGRIKLIKITRKGKAKEPRFVTVAEYEAVLESIKARNKRDIKRALRDRAIIILGFKYWLRKSELQGLKVQDLMTRLVRDNGELGKVYVLEWKAKGDKIREVYLRPETAEAILVWLRVSGLENSPEDYMFPSLYQGGRFRRDKEDPSRLAYNVGMDGAIESRFDELYRQEGLIRPGERSGITLHSLRRGGMKAAKEGGADIVDISWDAGHAEISTTAEYLGQRGFQVRHSSQYIQTNEVSTEQWLEEEQEELREEGQ